MNTSLDSLDRNTVTCGPLWGMAFEAVVAVLAENARKHMRDTGQPFTMPPIALFKAGFIVGQAEKVYLGACRAFMVRPEMTSIEQYDPADLALSLGLARACAEVYGLHVREYNFREGEKERHEIWTFRRKDAADYFASHIPQIEVNNEEWHTWRATLCGVPPEEIDLDFHKRRKS